MTNFHLISMWHIADAEHQFDILASHSENVLLGSTITEQVLVPSASHHARDDGAIALRESASVVNDAQHRQVLRRRHQEAEGLVLDALTRPFHVDQSHRHLLDGRQQRCQMRMRWTQQRRQTVGRQCADDARHLQLLGFGLDHGASVPSE